MRQIDPQSLVPPLKWAGGKRWLVPRILELLPKHDRYIEPFMGGGSVFFSIQPQTAILNDSNETLIETYRAIAESSQLVWRYLKEHAKRHSDSYYYKLRAHQFRSRAQRAAQFIYLNRTCWNGLFRVNLNGDFNVPRGTKDSVILPTDDFSAIAKALGQAQLFACDFESIFANAGRGDFVFVDPPYTVAHKHNGFRKYNHHLFSWDDQLRLRRVVDEAAKRGAKIIMSNADHESIWSLYTDYKIEMVNRSSVIAASTQFRGNRAELLIKCW